MAISAGTKKFRPTEAQGKAIESISVPMAVDAAAGSGKTRVLVERILRIVGDDWARLGEILAITFTEKAAGEFRAKLRPHVPPSERYRLDNAWIGTFHSFCARLIRRFGPAIDLDPSFSLLDENAAGLAMRRAVRDTLLSLLASEELDAANLVEEVGFATAGGALEELMGFRWHAERALENRDGSDEWESGVLDSLGKVFARVKESYSKRLDEVGALDFQELEIKALELLEKKSVAEACRGIFSHILVDEYQDTNDIQTELVLRLFDPAQNRLFIVGDEAQSIYRFRGANVSCFAKVRRMIEERRGETVRLAHNFRSRESIISFVNLSQGILADGLFSDPASPKPMEATLDDGEGPHVIELAVPAGEDVKIAALREREARAIADTIASWAKSGTYSYGDVVLLFRAMGAAGLYESALRNKMIPSSQTGGRGFLERTEVADLMAALRYAADHNDSVALMTLLRSPIVGLSDDALAEMAGDDGYGLGRAIETSEGCELVRELPHMAEHMRPSEILRRVVNEAGLELLWSGLDPSGAAVANIDRFVTIARDLEREVPTTLSDFTAFMSEMRRRGARLGDAPAAGAGSAVRLMTVHAAKGLEFPVVILPDLMRAQPRNTKQWIFSRGDARDAGIAFRRRDSGKPYGSRVATERFKRLAEDEAARETMESKRLLYVAMTRAIDALVVPQHQGIKDRGTWHGWVRETLASEKASFTKIEPARLRGATGAAIDLEDTGSYKPTEYQGASSMRLSVSQLDSYSVCPMQYYLKYVLGLPASEVTRDEPERLAPNVYGSIVHAMLARATEDPEELRASARTECMAQGVVAGEKRMAEFMADAVRAIELAGAGNIAEGARELPFEIRMGSATVSGTIDWLRPAKGGYEIVDYKTGTEKKAKLKGKAAQYEIQMQAYSLAAEEITGEKVVATRLVFPAAGSVVEQKMDPARRKAAKKELSRIVSGIAARDYKIKTKPPCESCIYKRNAMCWEARK